MFCTKENRIRSGAFGDVFKARYKDTVVAVKMFMKMRIEAEVFKKEVLMLR